MTQNYPEVITHRKGLLGHLEINRPRSLNALSAEMIKSIETTLREWAVDDSVKTVVITGAGERGLSAGGDIRSIHKLITEHRFAEADEFFAAEYALNNYIAEYPKPYVGLMDGVTLGGGLGVSAHGSHRVVTERSRIGMPEVIVGFTPDAGMSFRLSRAPGEIGKHLSLTGTLIDAADAVYIGWADYFVPSERLPDLISSLQTIPADEAISAVSTRPPESGLAVQQEWINACYDHNTLEDVINALQQHHSPVANATAKKLSLGSPTALAVALKAQQRLQKTGTLTEALVQEYRLATHLLRSQDLVEGVRAEMIDKDRQPMWSPPTVAALKQKGEDFLASYFKEAPGGDLKLADTSELVRKL